MLTKILIRKKWHDNVSVLPQRKCNLFNEALDIMILLFHIYVYGI